MVVVVYVQVCTSNKYRTKLGLVKHPPLMVVVVLYVHCASVYKLGLVKDTLHSVDWWWCSMCKCEQATQYRAERCCGVWKYGNKVEEEVYGVF